jgi:hypothetical protein
MLQFYLAAIQFALGDLPASTTPSDRLNAATHAQEKLGWRLGVDASAVPAGTLFEAIESAAAFGWSYLGASSSQRVSADIARDFDAQLADEDLRQIRLKLDAAGVRLLTYNVRQMPVDATGCRRLFAFSRKMGIETIIADPLSASREMIGALCDDYDVQFAIDYHPRTTMPRSRNPPALLKECRDRTPRLGICGDLEAWTQANLDPIETMRAIQHRLITLRVSVHENQIPRGSHRPKSRADQTARFFAEMARMGIKPTMCAVGFTTDSPGSRAELSQRKLALDTICEQCANPNPPAPSRPR